MKIIKNNKNLDRKIALITIDFRNSKSIAWNNRRRFGI